MSGIVYSVNDEDLAFEDVDLKDNSILINNKSFFISHFTKKSRYFGFFWNINQKDKSGWFKKNKKEKSKIDDKFLKVLDSIELVEKPEKLPDNITIKGKAIDIFDDFVNERYFIPSDYNSLCYELNYLRRIQPIFDIKRIFDNREWGRNYKIEVQKNKVAVITFEKLTDKREDKTDGKHEYKIYVAIAFDGMVKELNSWKNLQYEFDKNRNSPPENRYAYVPFEFYAKKLVFTVGFHKKDVIKESLSIMKSFDKKYIKELNDELDFKREPERTIDFAYVLALNALNSMSSLNYIEAGLPWFYDEWSRDEALSLNALIYAGDFNKVKKILLKLLDETNIKGMINTKLGDNNTPLSAEAFFYAAKVFDNLVSFAKKHNIEKYILAGKFYEKASGLIEQSLDIIIKHFLKGSLIYAKPSTTWMDSSYKGDTREGFNIEINAMMLYMYDLLYRTTGKEIYSLFASKLKAVIREKFWNGMYLVDNLDSKIVRPNVFIAYYFAPEILSDYEWEKCFDYALERLWFEWGGLSSIDKTNPLFVPNSTGEDPKSYHRGDSWFFVNNIAAIAMSRLNKTKYFKYITKVTSAGTKDILLKGCLGNASEISDASELTSRGALSQAWSNATYVELIRELFYKN